MLGGGGEGGNERGEVSGVEKEDRKRRMGEGEGREGGSE